MLLWASTQDRFVANSILICLPVSVADTLSGCGSVWRPTPSWTVWWRSSPTRADIVKEKGHQMGELGTMAGIGLIVALSCVCLVHVMLSNMLTVYSQHLTTKYTYIVNYSISQSRNSLSSPSLSLNLGANIANCQWAKLPPLRIACIIWDRIALKKWPGFGNLWPFVENILPPLLLWIFDPLTGQLSSISASHYD